ncbi:expressed unknown protein [Seminavis robusta]|uniref:Uncharacterized protein n=1 Tax=Seminavis robusta TaxID=568900 RepID=A0A9N8EFZ2_9STRA|nr:expressed unknown protein [Seminavis robusta]|eukprot:Sro935_g221970.1 n/a (153) ;mRNA; f:14717-15419
MISSHCPWLSCYGCWLECRWTFKPSLRRSGGQKDELGSLKTPLHSEAELPSIRRQNFAWASLCFLQEIQAQPTTDLAPSQRKALLDLAWCTNDHVDANAKQRHDRLGVWIEVPPPFGRGSGCNDFWSVEKRERESACWVGNSTSADETLLIS